MVAYLYMEVDGVMSGFACWQGSQAHAVAWCNLFTRSNESVWAVPGTLKD